MNEQFRGSGVDLVWNKGIAALCDRRIPDEFPDGRNYSPVPKLAGAFGSSKLPDNLISDPVVYRDIRDGDLVWVRLSWLKSFVKQVLPVVRASFVLVTGDSDSCVPSEVPSEARAILDCPKVAHWFTQNYDGTRAQERISPLPIGIDFHMLSERPIWGENITSPLQQERTLNSVRNSLPLPGHRLRRVYADFGWQRGLGLRHYRRYHRLKGAKLREIRQQIVRKLWKNEDIHWQTGLLSRTDMWRRRGEYAFVLSPHGMGLDCHRTWEALALGHIVLVPSSSLNALYAGLPVVPLESWSDVNSENLEKWLSIAGLVSEAVPNQLKASYWVSQMRSVAGPVSRRASTGMQPEITALAAGGSQG